MLLIRGSPRIGLLSMFLVLAVIGLANPNSNNRRIGYRNQADTSLQGSIHNDLPSPHGLQHPARDDRRPTAIQEYPLSATPTSYLLPTPPCYIPGPAVPWYDVDVDELCQCDHYTLDDNSAKANAGWDGGKATCGATCVPQIANQTILVNEASGSFSECMNACTGSFDRRKIKYKRQSDDFWFCHGVNFKKGELCQFLGAIQYTHFTGERSEGQCWDSGLNWSGKGK